MLLADFNQFTGRKFYTYSLDIELRQPAHEYPCGGDGAGQPENLDVGWCMAIEFTKVIPLTDGQSLPFHRYEPDDELFRNRRLDAFEISTSSLNSRLIFDGMVAIEGRMSGMGVLVCFTGSRACEFHRGLGQLFLDIRPAGAGLVFNRQYEPELTVTVFGVLDAKGPDGYAVPCVSAAAWSYANHGTGMFGRRKFEGHLPAFPVG